MATVRVKEKTYRELNTLAGTLLARLKRPASLDDVLNYLLKGRKLMPSDYAGTWNVSDEEET